MWEHHEREGRASVARKSPPPTQGRPSGALRAEANHPPGPSRAVSALSASEVLRLQRTIGNAQVARLFAANEDWRSTVHDVVGRGGGQPLAARTLQLMESRLGHDFSDVRVHTGAQAADSARSVGAHAYTVGSEVVLGANHPDLSSAPGQRLLAHELTHVVQQRSGPVDGAPSPGGIMVSDPADRFEIEAERVAERVTATTAEPGNTPRTDAKSHARLQEPSGDPSSAIQRFAVSDPPSALAKSTIRARYFGATDGAFRLTEESTGEYLWVKGTNEAPQRQTYASKVLKLVNVETPDVHAITGADAKPLFDHLTYLSMLGASTEAEQPGIEGDPTTFGEQLSKHRKKSAVVILANAPGEHAMGVQNKRKGRDTDADETARKFKEAFESMTFAQSVGRMMAADIFLGNFDRVGWVRTGGRGGKGTFKAHGGNFVVELQQKVLRAIDNDTNFESLDDVAALVKRNVEGQHGAFGYRGAAGMELLFRDDKAREALDGLIKAYSGVVSTGGNFKRDVELMGFTDRAMAGYNAAKATILTSMDDLKKEFMAMSPGDDSFSAEGFRARKSYAEIRQGGASHEDAMARTQAYLVARGSQDGPYMPKLVAIGTDPLPKGAKFASEVKSRSARLAQVAAELKADALTYMEDPTEKEKRLWVRRMVDNVADRTALQAPLDPFVSQARQYAQRPFASQTRAELKVMEREMGRLCSAFDLARLVVRDRRSNKA